MYSCLQLMSYERKYNLRNICLKVSIVYDDIRTSRFFCCSVYNVCKSSDFIWRKYKIIHTFIHTIGIYIRNDMILTLIICYGDDIHVRYIDLSLLNLYILKIVNVLRIEPVVMAKLLQLVLPCLYYVGEFGRKPLECTCMKLVIEKG